MKFATSFRLRFPSLFVFSSYALLTLLITWPLAAELGSAIPGSGGDAWVHVWTFDWVKDALLSGQNPFYTDRIFYPDGASLIFHNIAWIHIVVWLPLQLLFGQAAAYTLLFFLIFTFNGLTVYWLAKEFELEETAAFMAGLVAAFWPYTLSQNNHPNLIFIGWIPLVCIYLRRTLQNGRKRDGLLTAVFLTLLGYTRWQLLVIGGIPIVLFAGHQLWVYRANLSRRLLGLLLGSSLLAGLLMLPLLGPLLLAQATRPDPEALFVAENLEQTDLLAYVVPSLYHPIWGELLEKGVYQQFESDQFAPYIGFTTLLLAVVACVFSWRKSWFWLASAAVIMLLALGPELSINGKSYFTLPYAWIQDWFVVKIVRRPDRFNVVLGIPFAMLAGYGVAVLQEKWRDRHLWQPYWVGGLTLLLLVETAVAFPTLAWEIPAWYQQLAAEPDEFAVLGIPAHPRSRFDKNYMFYQLAHNKPLVEGHISRPPEEAFRFIDSLPFMREMRFGTGTEVPDEIALTQQLRPLAEAGVRYLVLHKQSLSPEDLAGWRNWLVLSPSYEDDEVAVYETAVNLAEKRPFEQVLKRDAAGRVEVGLIKVDVQPLDEVDSWQIDVVWGSETGSQNTYNVCFNLTPTDDVRLEMTCRVLSGLYPSARWQPNEIIRTSYQFSAHPGRVEDDYQLVVDLWQPQVGIVTDGKTAVGSLQVEPNLSLAAQWEQGIGLPTYDYRFFSGDDDALELVFHWEADRKILRNFKRYLHVIDVASGEIVMQEDVVPGEVVTEAWERNAALIDDAAYLDLGELEAGEYRIMIGLYDENTGRRLGAYQENGRSYPDNSVYIGRIIRR